MLAKCFFGSVALIGVFLLGGCDFSSVPANHAPANRAATASPTSVPKDPVALEIAGDRAAMLNDSARAVEFYRLAIQATEEPSKALLDKLGQQWMNVGRPYETLEVLVTAIHRFPDDADFRQKLVSLQSSLGLQWEAAEHLKWLIQRGHGNLNLLLIAADLSRPQTVESTCDFALRHYPSDLRPQYSIARLRASYSEWQEVAKLLKPVVERHPEFVPAQAFYLRALVELGDGQGVENLVKTLPAGMESHPQYWIAAGIWAQQQGGTERAAKAYWRATLLDENDGESLTRLSAALAELGRRDASLAAAKRAAKITALRDGIDSLRTWRNDSQTTAIKIAQSLQDLGRPWEATTWLQVAFTMKQNMDPQITELYKSIRENLSGTTPWQLPKSLVAANLDLSNLASIDWKEQDAPSTTASIDRSAGSIQFADLAAQVGLSHVCEIGNLDGRESGLAIYQSGAGGAGVIDFDLDGWPDVYLTAMDGDPLQANSKPNRLFRNQAGQFLDVTTAANVGDRGFAQGIAVGDYNSDGWPDLFVGNIGGNRLFRNNGDGTFADVTQSSGLTGNDWTTSVAIADIDGDGHADLVEVGYCGGSFVYEHQCMDDELNQPRSCSPLAFEAQRDCVWRGLGDGRFADASNVWFGPHEPGRGFGIIVGQLDSVPGLDIYIANDMTANHYWTTANDLVGTSFQLSQQATVRGLAVNERSLSQASMGIAAADADSDGDLDFLLTHFSDDYNTFYEQVSPGLWSDRSRRVGLAEPSQRMLGYGTQWIDCDNNGSLELVVANGDIDDFSHKGRLYRQPAQLFERSDDGHWFELPSDSLGDYFANEHLGRAVVTLDADRDRRTDLLFTHLFEPVSLLFNKTSDASKSVRFFLRATSSHPDAVGSRVTLQLGDKTPTQYLLAGNGYQCSSERCVTFGLVDAAQIDRVVVEWPNGIQQSFDAIDAGSDYLLVQGATDAFALASP